jgi:hypothetical protein
VFADDRGVDVGYLGTLGELVDDEGVERVGVRYGDVEQEVVAAGDDENPDGLRQSVGPVAERLDLLA